MSVPERGPQGRQGKQGPPGSVILDKRTAQIIRARLLIPAGLVGFIAACSIAIPVSVFVPKEGAAQNCEAITELAKLGEKRLANEKKQNQEFEHNSRDRFGLSAQKFQELVQKKHTEESESQAVLGRLRGRTC